MLRGRTRELTRCLGVGHGLVGHATGAYVEPSLKQGSIDDHEAEKNARQCRNWPDHGLIIGTTACVPDPHIEAPGANMCSMTSQGTAHGRFQRALDRGNLDHAEHAARELGWLSLVDALSLVVAYARAGSPKFEPAAVRWLARLALEGKEMRLGDVQLAAAALACLRGARSGRAEKTLLRLL